MALRAYQRKVQRLNERTDERSASIGERVLELVRERGPTSLDEITRCIPADPITMKGVLRDLVTGEQLMKEGLPNRYVYSLPGDVAAEPSAQGRGDLIAALVFSQGQLAHQDLAALCKLPGDTFEREIEHLLMTNRLQRVSGSGEASVYCCNRLKVPLDKPESWQAALFDHYQAVATTMMARHNRSQPAASTDGTSGGSTYHFEVWKGHPMEAEILSTLGTMRNQLNSLRRRVESFNDENAMAPDCRRVRQESLAMKEG